MSMLVPEVIVFRPEPKASELVNKLILHDIQAIAIEPFQISPLSFELNKTFYDDIIFTSTFAVASFCTQIDDIYSIIKHTNVWAIGSATAKALCKLGIEASHPIKANSEDLLEMLTQSKGALQKRCFLLVKGEGGRELLTQELSQDSTCLDVLNCYRRSAYDKVYLLNLLQQIDWGIQNPKILLYTSFDAINATLPIFVAYPNWKKICIVTVTNSRMLDWAKRHGFVKVSQLENLTYDQLVKQIIKLR